MKKENKEKIINFIMVICFFGFGIVSAIILKLGILIVVFILWLGFYSVENHLHFIGEQLQILNNKKD